MRQNLVPQLTKPQIFAYYFDGYKDSIGIVTNLEPSYRISLIKQAPFRQYSATKREAKIGLSHT